MLPDFDHLGFLSDWRAPVVLQEVTSCQHFAQVLDERACELGIPAVSGIARFSVAQSIQLMHFFFLGAVRELQNSHWVHLTDIPRITESAPALSVSMSDVFSFCRHRPLKSAAGIVGQRSCKCFGPVTGHIEDRPLKRNISYEEECSALL